MDQLAEYRARQQQRFAAEREASQERSSSTVAIHQPDADTPDVMQKSTRCPPPRPPALAVTTLREEEASRGSVQGASTEADISCPGTPRDYRARQEQRFKAEQSRCQPQEEISFAADSNAPQPVDSGVAQTTPPSRPARTPALTISSSQEQSSSTASCSSCPGTPREYRASQKERFAAERLQRQSLGIRESADIQASSGSTASCGYNPASPPTPRLRGSASLRAISAARAMRMHDASPLAGAAWPGHAQTSSTSTPDSRSSPALPPRAPKLAKVSALGQTPFEMPPRAPTSLSKLAPVIKRTQSSCAQAMDSAIFADLGVLCH